MLVNVLIFGIFLIATLVAVILADARNIRKQVHQMQADHELTVRKLYADYNDKALQLYLRYPRT